MYDMCQFCENDTFWRVTFCDMCIRVGDDDDDDGGGGVSYAKDLQCENEWIFQYVELHI